LDFGDILREKRILVCVGAGGVGKTTTAASLALSAARLGKRALVLTIDPAKRLANSLGLASLGHDIQEVPSEMIDKAGPRTPGGALFAMMLDQKRAFDDVVTTHASDPDSVKRIMSNPVYGQISGHLAGSQEYAALATLERFDESPDFDVIIVDTPPTAHALDFLDAPEKLTQAIDSPAVDWFRKLRTRGDGGWSVVGRTGAYMLNRLSKFTGSQFLDDLAVFFTEFNDVLGGFRARASTVFSLLRRPHVGFVLVASPEEMAMREAMYFYDRLRGSEMPFAGFVLNRVHASHPFETKPAALLDILNERDDVRALRYPKSELSAAASSLLAAHRELERVAMSDRATIARLIDSVQPGTLICQVPYENEDIHDIESLGHVGSFLVATL